MSQKIQNIAAFAEIISAGAIVITLLVLVVEVKENSGLLRATAAAENRNSFAYTSEWTATLSDKTLEALIKAQQPSTTRGDLSDVERYRVLMVYRSFIRRAEASYFMYRNGLLEEDIWQSVRSRIAGTVETGLPKSIWEAEVGAGDAFTPEFVAEINSYLPSKSN
ncbi:hypothetical protein R0135_14230 [Congregibacter variabilis]|uniref:DUF4760 domain-containing protein n=1 Tax=Congregibacter variabilis TaxID=3081200 RepID=A0ABZ0I1A9_9GAMM|nr:hypothetical protein R0135_14230 [Congregibacter sp. IMCC43200]